MLERDKYVEDTAYKYYPDFSIPKYSQHILSQKKPYYKLAFNEEQKKRWSSRINFLNNCVLGTLVAMLIPVFTFKKMPVLKRFKTKASRVLWSIGLILGPPNIVQYYLYSKLNLQIAQSYSIHVMDFMRYRQTGDLKIMNPDLKLVQF